MQDWRERNGDLQFSRDMILRMRDTIKYLYEHPDHQFRYVDGMTNVDTVCMVCENFKICHDPTSLAFIRAQQADEAAIREIPFLELIEFNQLYCFNELTQIQEIYG